MLKKHMVWSHLYQVGLEHLELVQSASEIRATSFVIAVVDDEPVQLHYRVLCDLAWRVREVFIELFSHDHDSTGAAGSPHTLDMRSDGEGNWSTAAGESLPHLKDCIDIDISLTPFTNTLPIRRLALSPGSTQNLTVSYIKVPDLTPQAMEQRYTCLHKDETGERASIYRYESVRSGFTAELQVDAEGLVIEYPELFHRVWSR